MLNLPEDVIAVFLSDALMLIACEDVCEVDAQEGAWLSEVITCVCAYSHLLYYQILHGYNVAISYTSMFSLL